MQAARSIASMGLRQDASGVSEIVGALMLVLVVSSAAFGFGLFLHQQAKATEAQKAADQERKMEKLALPAVDPKDATRAPFDASCPPIASDDSWHALSITVVSQHLHASTMDTIHVNKLTVRSAVLVTSTHLVSDATTASGSATVTSAGNQFLPADAGQVIAATGVPVGAYIQSVTNPGTVILSVPATAPGTVSATIAGLPHDFTLPTQPDPTLLSYNPAALVAPRQTVMVVLPNLAVDPGNCAAGSTAPYSLFGGAPSPAAAGPLKLTDALDVQVVTDLTNNFEKAFVPPSAIISVRPSLTVTGSYIFDGTGSQVGADPAFLTKWDWQYWTGDAACATPAGPHYSGHHYQTVPLAASSLYCVRLIVTDNSGLSGAATVSFTA